MSRTPRIAFLHTGAVVIAPVADLAREHLSGSRDHRQLPRRQDRRRPRRPRAGRHPFPSASRISFWPPG